MTKFISTYFNWSKGYSRKSLKADTLAGLTVALVLIPQSMAYAELAGLPPYFGLYAAFLPPMVAAWGRHAKAGFCPFFAATSSADARRMCSEKLHFPYLDEDTDVMFLVAYHARAGTLAGTLEHTMSSQSWHRVQVNAQEIGEDELVPLEQRHARLAAQGLDAAQVGADRGLAHDLERPDVAGGAIFVRGMQGVEIALAATLSAVPEGRIRIGRYRGTTVVRGTVTPAPMILPS